MKRLAFVISSLGAGGAEKVLSLMSHYFAQKGISLTLISLGDSKSFYPLPTQAKIIALGECRSSKGVIDSLFQNLRRIQKLRQALRAARPDLILSFMTETNILSIIAAKSLGIPVIASEHTNYLWQPSRLWNRLRHLLYPLASATTLLTQRDKENHYGFLPQAKILPNPFDFPPLSLTPKEKIILGVGRLIKDKGFDRLIRAFSQVSMGDYQLLIAGEGEEGARLEELIQSLGMEEKIHLLGSQKEIYPLYERASIFVLPSSMEGLSNALIEAMSMGCAVISFDCPYGPSEVITPQENGLLVPLHDEVALQEAMERLIQEEPLRQKLSQNAPKVRERFAIDKVMPQWEELMRSILDPTPSCSKES